MTSQETPGLAYVVARGPFSQTESSRAPLGGCHHWQQDSYLWYESKWPSTWNFRRLPRLPGGRDLKIFVRRENFIKQADA